jgi:hypothetical protein
MPRTAYVWLPILLIGAACASLRTPAGKGPVSAAQAGWGAKVASSEGSMLVCEMEEPTGSHIPRKVCRQREMTEADRRAVEELISKPPIQPCQTAPCAG